MHVVARAPLRCCFFFFQAEDGIRDVAVTGVQTCALPIYILSNEHCAPTAIHYTYDSYALANGAVRGILAQGKKDWFILGVDYAFGKAMTANVTDFLKEGGGKLVGTTFHPLNASDFSSFLLQAQ